MKSISVVEVDTEIPPFPVGGDPYADGIWPRSGVRGIIRRLRRWLGLPVIDWSLT